MSDDRAERRRPRSRHEVPRHEAPRHEVRAPAERVPPERVPADERRPAAPPRSPATARSTSRTRDELRRALSTPGAARRAFLLREVLGPPVALRGPGDDLPS